MSEWEDIRDDLIAKIVAITPTVEATKLFAHTGGVKRIWAQARGFSSAAVAETHRKFDIISDEDLRPTGQNYGLTARQVEETLVVQVAYYGQDRGTLDATRKSDAKDIRNALLDPHVDFDDALCNIVQAPAVLVQAMTSDGHNVVAEFRYTITYDEGVS